MSYDRSCAPHGKDLTRSVSTSWLHDDGATEWASLRLGFLEEAAKRLLDSQRWECDAGGLPLVDDEELDPSRC